MELKVWVDGVQRVVCGVTEATTCQEVVIALAQAIGRSGTNFYAWVHTAALFIYIYTGYCLTPVCYRLNILVALPFPQET